MAGKLGYSASGVGSVVTIISAAANVSGVIIRSVHLFGVGSVNCDRCLYINGAAYAYCRSIESTWFGAEIRVPPGQAVAWMGLDVNARIVMTYDILP